MRKYNNITVKNLGFRTRLSEFESQRLHLPTEWYCQVTQPLSASVSHLRSRRHGFTYILRFCENKVSSIYKKLIKLTKVLHIARKNSRYYFKGKVIEYG